MSNLWPQSEDKSLINAIGKYLQSLKFSDKLDEESKESLLAAIDCLKQVVSRDSFESSYSLEDLYNCYMKYNSNNDKKNDDNNDNNNNNNNDNNAPIHLSAELIQKRDKFLQFVQALTQHDFFKNCNPGSDAYADRLNQAREKYNTRFPKLAVPSLQQLGLNNYGEIIESTIEMDEKQASSSSASDNYVENKSLANKYKEEGNELLQQRKYDGAIDKYSLAIQYDRNNAVYYSNRAAAHSYLKQFRQAIDDAKKAIELDPKYIKAYVRLGTAEYEQGNYQEALKSFQVALDSTPSNDPNWESYVDRVQLCKQKLNINANNNDDNDDDNNDDNDQEMNNNESMPDLSGLANMFGNLGGGGGGGGGGQGNPLAGLAGLFGGGGGAGGGGGLGDLLKNPMMQQMAAKMMQDPNMMNKMNQFMQDPNMMNKMGEALNNPNAQNLMNNLSKDPSTQEIITNLMSNPDKMQQVMQKAMNDPEVIELQTNAELKNLIEKAKTGDLTAITQLMQKPGMSQKLQRLLKKYGKD